MSPNPRELDALVRAFASKQIDRRQFLGQAAALGLSASFAGTLLAACGTSESGSTSTSSAPPLGTTALTYRPEFDIINLDPAFQVNPDDAMIADCVLEGLVSYKPGTFEVVNTLAESLEPSPDNLRYHFKLKQGIEWQKGYGEVQASDVKYSFERIAGLTKPNLNSPYSGDWQALETVRVEGPYEGTIILKEPFAPLMHSTMPVESGKVLPEKAVQKLGKNYGTSPIGSGPYEFVNWVPGQKVTLRRFDNYGGANSAYTSKTPWTSIETTVIADDATAFEALSSGAPLLGFLGVAEVSKARATSSLKVLSRVTPNYYFLCMSVTEAPLENIWLRRAIRSAIDVPGIIKTAYDGEFARAYGIIAPTMSSGYWSSAPHYDQDIPLAKQYMSRSGLGKVSLRLAYSTSPPADGLAAQVIASNLQQIGIDVLLEPTNQATFGAIPGPGGGGPHHQLAYSWGSSEPDPYWEFVWNTCRAGRSVELGGMVQQGVQRAHQPGQPGAGSN